MLEPDLEIRVRVGLAEGITSLSYVVDSPSRAVAIVRPISLGVAKLACDPQTFHAEMMLKIENLHMGLDIDGSPLLKNEIPEKLNAVGRDLYHDLFPKSLKELYREARLKIRSLLIVSEEPWIPWEMVRPYDDSRPEDVIDDDFLCAQFELTRWLSDGFAPPLKISAGNVGCFAPRVTSSTSLPYLEKERAIITELATSEPFATDISPVESTLPALREMISRPGVGLIHFVGHGEHSVKLSNESGILVAPKQWFRASDLHGPMATSISRNRPLVFFNACRVARQGWSLVGLGGWSERWVRRCGCGCFIGPQWAVSDRLAYAFAVTFYHALRRGASIGNAAWLARRKVRKLKPGDPTWLSYSVFAHPKARVSFRPDQLGGWRHDLARNASQRRVDIQALVGFSLGVTNKGRPSKPEPFAAHPYTLLQTPNLIGREHELRELGKWASSSAGDGAGARIFSLVAMGGMGKSALAWKWFHEFSARDFGLLHGRIWWSFYEPDATFEQFVAEALAYTSGATLSEVFGLPLPDREAELLRILDSFPFLIVLDGLERAMIAYAQLDATRMVDDDLDQETGNMIAGSPGFPERIVHPSAGRHPLRMMQDARAGSFLRKLTLLRHSRFLVSTRLYPAELQDRHSGCAIPGSAVYYLEGLRGIDSLALWRALGARGASHKVLSILECVEHHPLVIRALAGEVVCYRPAPGDFDQWMEDHPEFDPASQLSLVQTRSHVLAFALRGLVGSSHSVACLIAALHMPAAYETLLAIGRTTDERSLDERALNLALSDLEDRGLVGWNRASNHYDMHPLVRGTVWEQLNHDQKEHVHRELRSHFAAIPLRVRYEIQTPLQVLPFVELCNSLLQLGEVEEAATIYRGAIGDSIWETLGNHRAAEFLKLFVPSDTNILDLLERSCRSREIMYDLAQALRRSGQLMAASATLERMLGGVHVEGWATLEAYALSELWGTLIVCGRLREADSCIRASLKANRSAGRSELINGDLFRACRLMMIIGEIEGARTILRAFIEPVQNRLAVDYVQAKCALLSGDLEVASAVASRLAEGVRSLPRYEIDKEARNWFLNLQALTDLKLGKVREAGSLFRELLADSRSFGGIEGEIKSLIGLAEASRLLGEEAESREHLDCCWESIERGPFVLEHANAQIVLAKLDLGVGDKNAAVKAAEAAFRLSWCDGPPYSHHWALQEARAILRALEVAEPEMPPFDEGNFSPLEELEILRF